jgi:pimeloyl-ACP methyl ester carboxylesterase
MADEWSRAEGGDGQAFVFAEAGEGPPVLLMHGFPDTPHGWERIAAAVAESGRRAVRPWLRGYHPETIVPGRPYDVVTLGRDPLALLDALGERDAVLVGHDWGAVLAYSAATQAPERVRAIVPIAFPHPADLPRNPATLWDARHFVGLNMPLAERRVRRSGFAYFDRVYRRWAPAWRGPERDASLAAAKRALSDPRTLHEALSYYRAARQRPSPDLRRHPPVPGLVVAGTTDLDPGVYRGTAERLAAGSDCLIAEGAGHWPHREREDEFIARLLSYLRGVAPG